MSFILLFLKIYFHYILERGKERRKRGTETLMYERNINQLPPACPQMETGPATQACALMGSQTGNLWVHRPVPNPLSHTSQALLLF